MSENIVLISTNTRFTSQNFDNTSKIGAIFLNPTIQPTAGNDHQFSALSFG
jgi:hypothetical protein